MIKSLKVKFVKRIVEIEQAICPICGQDAEHKNDCRSGWSWWECEKKGCWSELRGENGSLGKNGG